MEPLESLANGGGGPAPLLVVDGANVVGSVPDGWWRDRHGAAERLRDALVAVGRDGLPGVPGPLTVVLVVEGAARGVGSVPGVRVVAADGSGDDRIVRVVAEESAPGHRCLVVTADRGLRARVVALGAEPLGPRTVRPAGRRDA
ncbi:NTP pyrophosphohydrolase [Kitasatospora sp. NPDC088391]|uniref:NTP pyrophosphohydrolase n=1 Tax=Kitasatospora sp. NPDC088391 TaxID=3364074 RepID=UPI0037F6FE09